MQELRLSPGKHNELQRAIIDEFAPQYALGERLLYLGDAAKKNLFMDNVSLLDLRVLFTDDDSLPDVILYDSNRKWLLLIETVSSHGSDSSNRVVALEAMLANCSVNALFASAFPDF